MRSHDEVLHSALCRALLEYWMNHPAAKDTAAGIRDWWLRDVGDATCTEVQDVLEALVTQGWVMVRGQKKRLYGMDPNAVETVERFLREGPEMRSGE